MRSRSLGIALCTVVALLSACGSGAADGTAVSTTAGSRAAAAPTSGALLTDWPEFGLDPQRTSATNRPTGITAANIGGLRDRRIASPGTVDSSPIYLHGAHVRGGTHDVIVVTTTYGRTIALDADSGRRLWTFTPPGYGSLLGSAQITTATPVADPEGGFVFAASPDGLIHKLSLASGREAGGAWPVSVTRDPVREKLGAALNVAGSEVIAATSGYIGDAPAYQGHVVAIARGSGHIDAVFNTLCARRRTIIVPGSCPESDSAILSRGGAVVEPGGRRLLISTGNGTWDGRRYFGDSVLELTLPKLRLRQAFTPRNQAELNSSDTDLGSSAPALLGHNRVLIAGKDGVMRVLALNRLNGHRPGSTRRLGGEVQTLPTPNGGDQLFTAPAVWHHGKATTVFVATFGSTAAYALRNGRLHRKWESGIPGSSPVVAGGLLYVYNPDAGGIEVYDPLTGKSVAQLPGASGHWNSPIVVDGHVIEPEGDANDHAATGTIDVFTLP